MKVSPFIFVLIKDSRLILWDYKLHQQYVISSEYLDELCHFEATNVPNNPEIFSELLDNQIIVSKENDDYFDGDWKWDDLAKIFHIGTQDIDDEAFAPNKYSEEYLKDCEKNFSDAFLFEYAREGKIFKLPIKKSSKIDNANLLDTLQARRTSRNFNRTPISIEHIATMLEGTFATSDRDEEYYRSKGLLKIGQRKTSPSGGGLHPSEAYLLVNNVESLEKGVYHFNSTACHLTKIDTFNGEIGHLLNNQYFANDLSAGVFITSVFEKQWLKYKHSRAYRMALLDVGHLSQTLLLTATALGLSTWVSGAFNDTKISKLLKINNINERPIFFIGLGYGNNSPIDTETSKLLNQVRQ